MAAIHLHPLPSDEPLSRVVSAFLGLFVLALALAAAAVGLMMNIDFATREGLDVWKTSAYAGADVAEFMMPVVIMAMGWPWYKRFAGVVVWVVFLAISSFCIFSSVANVEAKKLKEVAVAENAYNEAEGKKKAADATLADPAVAREHTSVAELEALAKEASSAAGREGARGTCGKKCEDAHTEHRKLLERVGLAKSRDEANATLREVSLILVKGLPDPAGFAVILAGPLGMDVKTLSRGHSMATSLGAVVAIKLAVLFFTPTGSWLSFRGGRKRKKAAIQPEVEPDAKLTREPVSVAPPVQEIPAGPAEAEPQPEISIQKQDELLALPAPDQAPKTPKNVPKKITKEKSEPVATITKLTPTPKAIETGRGAEVRTWLRETLAAKGPTLTTTLIEMGSGKGFNASQVRRAIDGLGCKKEKAETGRRDLIISLNTDRPRVKNSPVRK